MYRIQECNENITRTARGKGYVVKIMPNGSANSHGGRYAYAIRALRSAIVRFRVNTASARVLPIATRFDLCAQIIIDESNCNKARSIRGRYLSSKYTYS